MVDNDANLGALAEHWWGVGRGIDDIAYIKVATGIGSGHVIGGEIYRGATGVAGEIGHISIDPHGKPCICGLRGCLVTLIGGPALVARAAELSAEFPGSTLAGKRAPIRDIEDAALAGDPLALQRGPGSGRAPGPSRGRLLNLMNPSLVIVGGDLARLGDLLLDPLRETVKQPHAGQLRDRGGDPGQRTRPAVGGHRRGHAGAEGRARGLPPVPAASRPAAAARRGRPRHEVAGRLCSRPALVLGAAAGCREEQAPCLRPDSGRTNSTDRPASRPIPRAGASTSAPTGATPSSSTTPTARGTSSLDGEGHLAITARARTSKAGPTPRAASRPRASSRRRAGRFEARIKLPAGQGHLARLLAARRRHRTGGLAGSAARSTSWSTADRNRACCTAACTAPAIPATRAITGVHTSWRRAASTSASTSSPWSGTRRPSPGTSTATPT